MWSSGNISDKRKTDQRTTAYMLTAFDVTKTIKVKVKLFENYFIDNSDLTFSINKIQFFLSIKD